LHSGSKSHELIRKVLQVQSKNVDWQDQSLDLSAFAGEEVGLEFNTHAEDKSEDYRFAWSSPEIYDISSKRTKPNIILISVDTLRADRLNPQKAPNLAALAEKSIVFSNAYCTYPGTLPSHTSVMTGLYVAEHQVGKPGEEVARHRLIPHELSTIAQVAKEQGYFTTGITDGGFVSGFYGFDQGFQQYVENKEKTRNRVATIDNGVEWLKKNATRPFFLFLHSYTVHEPFNPPVELFRKLFPNPALQREPSIGMDWLLKVVAGKVVPTQQEKEFVRQLYDAEVYFYDQNFGRLMKQLQQLNLDQNTVILIFGDHGELFFDRDNSYGHGKTLTKEEIQVPLILHIPGKQHEERKEIVSLVDVFPTLTEMMGSTNQYSVDGMSLLIPPNHKKRFNRTIYYEVTYGGQAQWGTQSNEFKLVLDKQKKKEYFYDLRKDPYETENLMAKSSRSMQSMKDLLSAYVRRSITPNESVKASQEKQETGELREQLKALGYIND
jgi:arylsulfatase A-like enzyme